MKNKTTKHLTTYSWSYRFASIFVHFLHKLFYKNICIIGKENVPKKGSIIFAPNHQNALMDPLAVIFTIRKQVVFLARGDIFNLPIVPSFFRWLKIVPIYRIRNGISSLKNNSNTFDTAIKVLENKRPIGLFPEAKHNNKRQLLPFKKGIPRIAFQAEEKHNFTLDTLIIPVGIYYNKYNTFRSNLRVEYGKPLYVKDYHSIYIENQNRAMLKLACDMQKATSSLTIDITDQNEYNTFESIREIYCKQLCKNNNTNFTINNAFLTDKEIIKKLEDLLKHNQEKFNFLKINLLTLNTIKDKYKICNCSLNSTPPNIGNIILNFLLQLLCTPVFIYGITNNAFVYLPPKILSKKIKDLQFHSSIKFLWALFLAPIFYVVQTLLVWKVTENYYIALAYFLSIGLLGFAAQLIFEWFSATKQHFALWKLKTFKQSDHKKLKQAHKNIIETLNNTINM